MSEDPKNKRLFGTNGIRGIPNEDLTPEFCMMIVKAIGTFFNGKIVIGSDNRLSGEFMVTTLSGTYATFFSLALQRSVIVMFNMI